MGSEDAKTTVELTAELTDIYTKEDYPKFNRRVSKDREQPEQAGERKPLNMQTSSAIALTLADTTKVLVLYFYVECDPN